MTEQNVVEVPMYRFVKTQVIDGKLTYFWEPDTILYDERYVTVELPKESFPRTLRSMTATRAGEFGMAQCKVNGWEPTPEHFKSAMVNLEIDMD